MVGGRDTALKDGGACLFDVNKSGEQGLLLQGNRHVIASLHVDEHFGVDAMGGLCRVAAY